MSFLVHGVHLSLKNPTLNVCGPGVKLVSYAVTIFTRVYKRRVVGITAFEE